jgi:hypothetical protein
MQTEGARTSIVQVMYVMEYVGSEKDPLIEFVGTPLRNTNSTLFQIVKNFKTSFQNKTKQVKDIIVQNAKE